MKALLLVTTWLSVGPTVLVQPVDTLPACRAAMQASAQMLQAQALSNLTGAHRDLALQTDALNGDLTLRTPVGGRDVARLRCIAAEDSK